MTSPNHRTAASALDAARVVVARLDPARDSEDNAADLLDAWNAAETALRSLLGGSSLAGQQLVRELRQRQHLSLEQAHTILEFQAARDRANRPSYQPTPADIDAARHGLAGIDAVIRGGPTAVIAVPSPSPASAPVTDYSPLPPPEEGWRHGSSAMVVIGLLFVLLTAGGGVVYYTVSRGGSSSAEKRGVDLYTQGRREAARGEFTKAVRDDPNRALPHIYLGRIGREDRDFETAQRELEAAVRLEPQNYLAHREMASHLLAAGKDELARRFFVRALQLNETDRTSQGFLGCALARLGRYDESRRWLDRAGTGDWSSCASQAPAPAPR